MNPRQIESWALRIIECVENGQPNEDFLVELKSSWIDSYQAARRIAGHANAARGENVLWLIGVDEKEGVKGAEAKEPTDWCSKVKSHFSELAPEITLHNIPVDGKVVVALLLQTERAPFIVKNPKFGSEAGAIELEIPWRENTRLRAARRSDLIRLLSPLELLPEIEIIDQKLEARIASRDQLGNEYRDELILMADLYIVPRNDQRLVFPFHRCEVTFSISSISLAKASYIQLEPARSRSFYPLEHRAPGSFTIQSAAHEIIVDGPGRLSLYASAKRPNLSDCQKKTDIEISIYLEPAGIDRQVIVTTRLPYPEEKYPS